MALCLGRSRRLGGDTQDDAVGGQPLTGQAWEMLLSLRGMLKDLVVYTIPINLRVRLGSRAKRTLHFAELRGRSTECAATGPVRGAAGDDLAGMIGLLVPGARVRRRVRRSWRLSRCRP